MWSAVSTVSPPYARFPAAKDKGSRTHKASQALPASLRKEGRATVSRRRQLLRPVQI
jgi:hypothetical protein